MDVDLPLEGPTGPLPGSLHLVERPRGLVIFAHGSGSSRKSPRNSAVAAELRAEGFATFLFDLLTEAEAANRANVFDIPLLGQRVAGAIGWARARADLESLPLCLFGASTGAAAALEAAARRPDDVAAVVSRGGRPDLAGKALSAVRCPTLLIVGGGGQPGARAQPDGTCGIAMPEDAADRPRGDASVRGTRRDAPGHAADNRVVPGGRRGAPND